MLGGPARLVALGALIGPIGPLACAPLLGIDEPRDRPVDASVQSDAGCDALCETTPCTGRACSCEQDASACPNGCGDTTSDPKNCGKCGVDCAAQSATAACVASVCVRSCEAGYADCNQDLGLGWHGDGCETDVRTDPKHCGSCQPCPAALRGVATCTSGTCGTLDVTVTHASVSALYGNGDGGSAFRMPCAANEAVIGLNGVGTDAVYGLGAACGRLELKETDGGYAVHVTPTSVLPNVGGNVTPPPAAFSLQCPPSTVVSAVSGTTWAPPSYMELLKEIAITCSSLTVDSSRNVTHPPAAATLEAGVVSGTVRSFSESCGPSGAVDGFEGRSGALIDGIAISCSRVSVTLQ
jgi:hypothetical protein